LAVSAASASRASSTSERLQLLGEPRNLGGRPRLHPRSQRLPFLREAIPLRDDPLPRLLGLPQLAPCRRDPLLQLDDAVLHAAEPLPYALLGAARARRLLLERPGGVVLDRLRLGLGRRGLRLGLRALVGGVVLGDDGLDQLGGLLPRALAAPAQQRPSEIARGVAGTEQQLDDRRRPALGGDRGRERRIADLLHQRLVDERRHLGVALIEVDEGPRQVPDRHRLDPHPLLRRPEPSDELPEALLRQRDDQERRPLVGVEGRQEGHVR